MLFILHIVNYFKRVSEKIKSLEDYNEAIRLDPKDAAAYYNRGLAKNSLEQYKEAIEDFDEAVRLELKHVKALTGERVGKVGASSIAPSFFNAREESVSSQSFSKSVHSWAKYSEVACNVSTSLTECHGFHKTSY